MIDITQQAVREIRERFAASTDGVTVRVTGKTEGCKVPILSLEQSDATDRDEVLELKGVTVLVDRELESSLGGVKIRYDASHWGGGHLSVSPLVNLVAGTCGDCRC